MSPRILFVEHDDGVLQGYQGFFQRRGYVTCGAQNATQCAELLEEFQPDAVVLEPEFFDENGLLEIARRCSVPVVVVTRMRAIPRVECALRVTAHYLKPVSMKQLEATLRGATTSNVVSDSETMVDIAGRGAFATG